MYIIHTQKVFLKNKTWGEILVLKLEVTRHIPFKGYSKGKGEEKTKKQTTPSSLERLKGIVCLLW